MTKRKTYCLISICISVILTILIARHAEDIVYAAKSSTQTSLQAETSSDTADLTTLYKLYKFSNHWIYDVDTPLDMYGADETTTTQIQTVAPESSFQVTYSQDNSNIVAVMTNILDSLDTDTIDQYQVNLSVYIILPSDFDTSDISFTLEGFYSLFDIDEVNQEDLTSDYPYTLIELSFTSKTNYSSIDSLLSDFKAVTEGKIILSGLTVPSSYSMGDLFYVIALPQGTVNATIGDIIYQFEAITYPDAGDDGMTDTFPESQSDGHRAHVTFQVGTSETETETSETETSETESETETSESESETGTPETESETETSESKSETGTETSETQTETVIKTMTSETSETTTESTAETSIEDSMETSTEDTSETAMEDTSDDATESSAQESSDVETGDETNIFGWLTICILSIVTLFVLGLIKRTH